MLFLGIYILVFIVLLVLSVMDKGDEETDNLIYLGISLILFCLAAFKPLGIDNDALPYVGAYFGQTTTGLDDSMEESFYIICEIIRSTIDIPEALFFVYALLAIPLTMYSIRRLTPLWFPALLLFVSKYYLVEDVTQIRASVVFAMYLFALYYLADGKRLLYLGIILISAIFHISALVLIPVALLSNKHMGTKMRLAFAMIPIIGYFLYFIKIDIFMASFIPYVQDKIELYEKMRDTGVFLEEAKVFDKMFLLELVIYYFLLFKYEVIQEKFKYTSLMLKLYSLFFAVYCTFGFLPVLAGRLSEFFGIMHIFLIPCIIYTVKPTWTGKLAVCCLSVLLLFFSLTYMKLLNLDA